jgi:DNA polymerase III delta' subunit
MKFTDLKGQNRALRLLKGAIEKERIANAYLFSGPPQAGKFLTAQTFAASLLCQSKEIDPCGTCLACRKIEKSVHPDLIVMQKDGQNIKIDQIREIKKIIRFGPHEARYKVLILKDADELSADAAHSFLKILEEPSEKVVFILVTDKEGVLPPTILSRCQRVLFNALPKPLSMPNPVDSALIKLDNLNARLTLSAKLALAKDQIEEILNALVLHYYSQLTLDLKALRPIRLILHALQRIQLRTNLRLTLDNLFLNLAEV